MSRDVIARAPPYGGMRNFLVISCEIFLPQDAPTCAICVHLFLERGRAHRSVVSHSWQSFRPVRGSLADSVSPVRVCTLLSRLSIRQWSRIAVHSGGGASPSFRRSSAWRARVGVGGGPGRPCAVATKCSAGATDLPSAKTGSLSAADGCDVAAAGASGLRTKDPLSVIRDEEVHVQGGARRVPELGAGGAAGNRAGDPGDPASRPLPNQKGEWFYRAVRPKVPQIMAMSGTRAVRLCGDSGRGATTLECRCRIYNSNSPERRLRACSLCCVNCPAPHHAMPPTDGDSDVHIKTITTFRQTRRCTNKSPMNRVCWHFLSQKRVSYVMLCLSENLA